MTTIVKGHGARIDDATTFVPTGTTVKMYADYDVNLSTSAALVAIASGSWESPNDSADAGTDIANYLLATQDDGFYAKWMAMGEESGTPIKWVGTDLDDRTRLCNGDGSCDPSTGSHDCSGVFGKVDDTEIILLACRGYISEHSSSQAEYGSDEEDPLHDVNADMDEWLEGFMGRVQADPVAAEAEYDNLPEGTQALLLSRGKGKPFIYGRWVRNFADADDVDGLFNHLRQNSRYAQSIQRLLTNVALYGDALDQCAARNPARFKDWLDADDGTWRDILNARPGVVTALEQIRAAEPTLAWEEFENLNRDYLKALPADEGATFWQLGETLVIGGQYRTPYGNVLVENGGSEGTITMAARGSTFSKGEVYVEGASDEAAFEKAFAKLSGKTVKFGG